jgi:hypothetical protein
MSASLTDAIIRGAGGALGRNMVNGRRRSSLTSSRSSLTRSKKSDLYKAIEFEIKGRVNTMVGKCYNMLQHFEDSCNSSINISKNLNIDLWHSFAADFNKVKNKINDVAGYLELIGEGENELWLKILNEMSRIVNIPVEYYYDFIIASPHKSTQENITSIINTYKQCFPNNSINEEIIKSKLEDISDQNKINQTKKDNTLYSIAAVIGLMTLCLVLYGLTV